MKDREAQCQGRENSSLSPDEEEKEEEEEEARDHGRRTDPAAGRKPEIRTDSEPCTYRNTALFITHMTSEPVINVVEINKLLLFFWFFLCLEKINI